MPLPTPRDDETQQEFISRCMADDTMQREFTDREQRAAVCFSQWRRKAGKALDKDVRRELRSPDPRVKAGAKAGAGDQGWLEGYASVFNVVDAQDEVVRPGAFAKSVKERVPAGKVKLMARHMAHGGDVLDVVGTVTEAKEDEYGLWIHAEFAGTQAAQTVRQVVAEGHVGGLSIGYLPVQWSFAEIEGKQVVELRELKLLEVTVTALPANEAAAITAAKAVVEMAESVERDVGALSGKGSRDLTPAEAASVEGALRKLDEIRGVLASFRAAEPEGTPQGAALHSAWVEVRRKRLRLKALAAGAKAFRHSSKVAENEPAWSRVDKTKLPRIAFADQGDPDKVSTWRYPHHWVEGGGDPDENGRYTTGKLWLHEGGLKAAWAAAQGARSGREAPAAVKAHLNAHRKDLGLDEKSESVEGADQGRYECECLDCGYIMQTDQHCRDVKCPKCGGEMRRVERPGPGQRSTGAG